ncbi:hypothetical protein ACFLV0_00430 [Chloroflexota bacterium]
MNNSQYEVLSPWAEADPIPLKGILPRATDLTDKTIGLFCHAYKVASLPIFKVVERQLKDRFPELKISWFVDEKHSFASIFESEDKAKVGEWIKEEGVDIVIVGRGD